MIGTAYDRRAAATLAAVLVWIDAREARRAVDRQKRAVDEANKSSERPSVHDPRWSAWWAVEKANREALDAARKRERDALAAVAKAADPPRSKIKGSVHEVRRP